MDSPPQEPEELDALVLPAAAGNAARNTGSEKELDALVLRAAAGDSDAVNALLTRFRPYLRLMGGLKAPAILRQREDASDLVQKTLTDAARGIRDFRGETLEELEAWLMRILDRNLLQAIRWHTADKRDVRRETDPLAGEGAAGLVWRTAAAGHPAASHYAFRGEAAMLLAEAIEKLPHSQRVAVSLRYLAHQPLTAIAETLETSPAAAAGLVRRGVEALRILLPRELAELS
jgi:RNA polymerase sigma-70 factor (ECF subfamily)